MVKKGPTVSLRVADVRCSPQHFWHQVVTSLSTVRFRPKLKLAALTAPLVLYPGTVLVLYPGTVLYSGVLYLLDVHREERILRRRREREWVVPAVGHKMDGWSAVGRKFAVRMYNKCKATPLQRSLIAGLCGAGGGVSAFKSRLSAPMRGEALRTRARR